jgi:hypothetical protein
LLAGRVLLQAELDVREARAEFVQDGRQHLIARRADEADRQPSDLARGRAAEKLLEVVGVSEQRATLLEQQPAGVGELDSAAVAPEELDAQLLRDVQALGRPSEVQLLGDGDEVAQVTEVDG